MMGRYFAQFDESPSEKVVIGNRHLKEYWVKAQTGRKTGRDTIQGWEEGIGV